MKSILSGCFGLLLLLVQLGCCTVGPMGACGTGACGTGACGLNAGQPLLGRVADRFASTHCTSGCGEVYWDEQINEPPVCDPCGYGGEFVGGQSCARCPGAYSKFRQLLGFTYAPGDCSTCSATGSTCSDGSCSTGFDSVQVASSEASYAQQPVVRSMPARQSQSTAPSSSGSPTPATRKPGPVQDLEPNQKLPPAPSVSRRSQPALHPGPVARIAVGSGANVRQASHY